MSDKKPIVSRRSMLVLPGAALATSLVSKSAQAAYDLHGLQHFDYVAANRGVWNDCFTCAENAGQSHLVVDRANLGAWEEFYFYHTGNFVRLWSEIAGKWVRRDPNDTSKFIADASSSGSASGMEVVPSSGGTFRLVQWVNGTQYGVTLDAQWNLRIYPGTGEKFKKVYSRTV